MATAILHLLRGRTAWQVSRRGIPGESHREPSSPTDSLTTVPTPFPRDMNVEAALRSSQALYPAHEVRILNWHRPKQDA